MQAPAHYIVHYANDLPRGLKKAEEIEVPGVTPVRLLELARYQAGDAGDKETPVNRANPGS